MIKFVVRNKSLLLALNKLPLVRNFFVYDFSLLNSIEDESFYNLVFSHIIVSNGLTKTTRSGRFKDLDSITLQLLQNRGRVSIHDVGVSNGITSLELYEAVQQQGIDADFCLSDKFAKMYYNGAAVKRFYDADGQLMSVNFLFMHFSPRIGKLFFLSRWLFTLFQKNTVIQKGSFKEIILLAPAVYKKIEEGKIRLLEFDVFNSKTVTPFNFVRCMNVLMPAYFSTDRIVEGVNNLATSLAEGGALLLGRTDADNTNHASFYTLQEHQLKPSHSVNNGFDYYHPA